LISQLIGGGVGHSAGTGREQIGESVTPKVISFLEVEDSAEMKSLTSLLVSHGMFQSQLMLFLGSSRRVRLVEQLVLTKMAAKDLTT
jgi:hypothetical protein